MVNGLDALALTKLDVLDDLDEIKICAGYRIKGREIDQVPYDANQMSEAEPIYEQCRDGERGLSACRNLKTCLRKRANISPDWPSCQARRSRLSPQGPNATKQLLRRKYWTGAG